MHGDPATWDDRRHELKCHLRIQCERKRAREIMQFDVSARQIKGGVLYSARFVNRSAFVSNGNAAAVVPPMLSW